MDTDSVFELCDQALQLGGHALQRLRRLHAVSEERFALFRRFLPGADSPCGVFDREVIEAAIAAGDVAGRGGAP